jgi:hypothetical protein
VVSEKRQVNSKAACEAAAGFEPAPQVLFILQRLH